MDIKEKKNFNLQEIGLPRLIIIILAGIVLLVLSLPSGSGSRQSDSAETTELSESDSAQIALDAMEQYTKKKEEELEKILGKVAGIGTVQVMITLASSEEQVALQDDNTSEESNGEGGENQVENQKTRQSAQHESVLVKQDGEEVPYIVQIVSPEVEGVVVVAQGAGEGSMDTEIIEAVQALFDLQPHKIRVMRME